MQYLDHHQSLGAGLATVAVFAGVLAMVMGWVSVPVQIMGGAAQDPPPAWFAPPQAVTVMPLPDRVADGSDAQVRRWPPPGRNRAVP
ncbi:hypothetical protein [Pseudooceanicola sp.]|uniref:hypothetical protein n=1 Tax=Pseudooceanicola sp. TaxID=1914328 RepID=UPI0035C72D3F